MIDYKERFTQFLHGIVDKNSVVYYLPNDVLSLIHEQFQDSIPKEEVTHLENGVTVHSWFITVGGKKINRVCEDAPCVIIRENDGFVSREKWSLLDRTNPDKPYEISYRRDGSVVKNYNRKGAKKAFRIRFEATGKMIYDYDSLVFAHIGYTFCYNLYDGNSYRMGIEKFRTVKKAKHLLVKNNWLD